MAGNADIPFRFSLPGCIIFLVFFIQDANSGGIFFLKSRMGRGSAEGLLFHIQLARGFS
jgi:hypothetical protein